MPTDPSEAPEVRTPVSFFSLSGREVADSVPFAGEEVPEVRPVTEGILVNLAEI